PSHLTLSPHPLTSPSHLTLSPHPECVETNIPRHYTYRCHIFFLYQPHLEGKDCYMILQNEKW
ncbi:hypothetical protein DPEC_G00296640, partial [Dallia pectoralis]